jgi:beta-glucosidase
MTTVDRRPQTERSDGTLLRFPPGFRWGAATAAYQIEGAVGEGGRTPSIWDTFSHVAGRVAGGDTGDVAADHYGRVAEDVDIMAGLGLTSYRFSTSWSRVQPHGSGPASAHGMDFYSRLVDLLLDRGIHPVITLYHWDLPQDLEDQGGWSQRITAERFAEYADLVSRSLGDRVSSFTTLNEPWCSAFLGYGAGVHAPGVSSDITALRALHHLLLAHGKAVEVLRSNVSEADLSIALNLAEIRPASESAADRDAARRIDALANRSFLGPLFGDGYPADLIADTAAITEWDFVEPGDLPQIARPIDSLGVNYYTPMLVGAHHGEGPPESHDGHGKGDGTAWPGSADRVDFLPQRGEHTSMDWVVDPTGLRDLLLRVSRVVPDLPILVTENGAAFDEVVAPDGQVHDQPRLDYLHSHLAAVHDAIEAGADIRGYYVWSLLDNFEWAHGYAKRFGIVRVDFETGERLLKDSATWYAEVIAANAIPAFDVPDEEPA